MHLVFQDGVAEEHSFKHKGSYVDSNELSGEDKTEYALG